MIDVNGLSASRGNARVPAHGTRQFTVSRTRGFAMADTTGGGGNALSAEELKKALKAFKKRLKLTRLDNESRITASPLSGRASHVVAITPPNQFPAAVWEEL